MRVASIFASVLLLRAVCSHDELYAAGPAKVEIVRVADGFQLLRSGEPYYIEGAVYWEDPDGRIPLRTVAECGGNSVRCGGRNVAKILDAAEKLGLTVTVGLPLKMESVHGFDYDDERAVRQQFDEMKQVVESLKDHPALLMWGVGNELSVGYTNKRVWDAVDDVAEMIHRIDPNHPTMTTIGDGSLKDGDARLIRERCPHLDLLGINYYKGIEAVPQQLRDQGWDRPHVVTEWGPSGHWQVPRNKWRLPIEETSTEKAERYIERYRGTMLADRSRCLGSYVFMWGQKQEQTHTWYGMFLARGERLEAVNAMQYLWTGKWPGNRAPAIRAISIDGRAARELEAFKPGSRHQAAVEIADPDSDSLSFTWEILPEPTKYGYGGRGEQKPAAVAEAIGAVDGEKLELIAPDKSGPYRAFVTVLDGQGNAATANIPFQVER